MPTISIFLNLNVHEIDIQIAHDAPCLLPNLVRRRVYLHKSVETPEAMCQFYLPVKLKYTTQENEERCDGHSKGRPCWGHRKTPPPPFFGRGLSHDLVRTCSPLPHDSELSPHFDQFCQPPSTTSEIFSETNCRKIQNQIALKAK